MALCRLINRKSTYSPSFARAMIVYLRDLLSSSGHWYAKSFCTIVVMMHEITVFVAAQPLVARATKSILSPILFKCIFWKSQSILFNFSCKSIDLWRSRIRYLWGFILSLDSFASSLNQNRTGMRYCSTALAERCFWNLLPFSIRHSIIFSIFMSNWNNKIPWHSCFARIQTTFPSVSVPS